MTKSFIAAAALLAFGTAASAANLVTNGDFETGSFTGWTQFGNTGFTSVNAGSLDGTGQRYASFGPVGSTGGIEQTLTVTTGATYELSFDLFDHTPGSTFSVSYNGATLYSLIGTTVNSTTQHFDIDFTGAAGGQLAFAFQNDPSYTYLDNVKVAAAVPEAGTSSMMVAGFALLGLAATRRRKAR